MKILTRCCYSLAQRPWGRRACLSLRNLLRGWGMATEFRLPIDALDLPQPALAALMRLWQRVHWSSGDGMMPGPQLLEIYRLACAWPVAGDIVELGVWRGLTTTYLATATMVRGGGRVYAVDTFRGTREDDTRYPSVDRHGGETLTDFRRRTTTAGVSGRIQTLIGNTVDMAAQYPGGPVAVCVVDADHSYGGVRSDFEAWLPHMADGGILIFHDLLMPEVARCLRDHVLCHPLVVDLPGVIHENIHVVTINRAGRDVTSTPVPKAPALAC